MRLRNSATGRVVFTHRTDTMHTHRTEHALRRCAERWARRSARLDREATR